MRKVYIDFETRSAVDIKAVGAWRYAEHPATDILCLAYAVDDEPVTVIRRHNLRSDGNNHKLRKLAVAARRSKDTVFVAHNAAFEQAVWRNHMARVFEFAELECGVWRDTMAKCYAHALPGSLKDAAKVLKLPEKKDMDGRDNMLRLSKPRKDGSFIQYNEDPEAFEKMYAYCAQDVNVMRAIDKVLRDLPAVEQTTWEIDQRINQQGLYLDMDAVKKAVAFIDQEKKATELKFAEAVDGEFRPTQRKKLASWLKAHGHSVPNTQKATLTALAEEEELSEEVSTVLDMVASANKTSLAKYGQMLKRATPEGLLREAFAYHGAHTGRWAGRGVQLQNLPRPTIDSDVVVDALKKFDFETFSWVYNVNQALSSGIRGMIVPPDDDTELFCADLSQMESRILAWLANEEFKLGLFRDGADVYRTQAAIVFGVPVNQVTDDQRQVGKVQDLSYGFQGGINAGHVMCKGYGVNVRPILFSLKPTADELSSAQFCYRLCLVEHKRSGAAGKPVDKDTAFALNILKDRWRAAHPNIVQFWWDLEQAAIKAVDTGKPVHCDRIKFFKHGRFLFCKLPSGRCLAYPYPRLKEGKRGNVVLSYYGNKGWETTYGGKLAENIVQAVQRDLLRDAMIRLEDKYPVCGHVHDEVWSYVPVGLADLDDFIEIVRFQPKWADGLPINAKGFSCRRYRK